MKHLVVWSKCSVDNPTTGESTILVKDQELPDYVDDFTRFVLVQSGAVRAVEDDAAAPPALPEPVRLPEHPPLTSDAALAERGTLAGDAAERLREQADQPATRRRGGRSD